jgi:hypothetical protein
MEKSSQIARKFVPLKHFFPLKVVPLIEVLLYLNLLSRIVPLSHGKPHSTRNVDTLIGIEMNELFAIQVGGA